jgi:cytochrome c peroxidase
MRSLVFTDTYYDAYKAGDYTPTQEELAGEAVFATHCAACHPPPLFTDFQFHNIGLDTITGGGDLNFLAGRARITGDAQDAGKYKTPTLRYWMHTAPFMHNGTLPDLDAVLAHYRYGVQDVPTLDAMLKKSGAKPGIALSDEEVRSIQNFLGLLNTFHDTK